MTGLSLPPPPPPATLQDNACNARSQRQQNATATQASHAGTRLIMHPLSSPRKIISHGSCRRRRVARVSLWDKRPGGTGRDGSCPYPWTAHRPRPAPILGPPITTRPPPRKALHGYGHDRAYPCHPPPAAHPETLSRRGTSRTGPPGSASPRALRDKPARSTTPTPRTTRTSPAARGCCGRTESPPKSPAP